MKRKLVTAAFAVVCLVCLLACWWIYRGIYGYQGTAANTNALAQIYEAADPNLAAFSTNSFLHKLRFTTPIRWHRTIWRPFVAITSQIDVATFRRDMITEPFVDLHPRWNSQGTNTTYEFKILHRLKDDWMVETTGTLDVLSGAFAMRSQTFFAKIDDSWWYQLTNSRQIDFKFEFRTD